MRTRRQRLGDAAEAVVAHRLRLAGWDILGRQVRVGRDELDLVALDPGPPPQVVVVEVRWRASRAYGWPEETIDRRKLARLRRAALALVAGGRLPDGRSLPRAPLRLDVAVVEPDPERPGRLLVRHLRGVD